MNQLVTKVEMKKEFPTKVEALDARAMILAKQFIDCEIELVSIFVELGKSHGYLYYKCNSMFEYGVKRLKLTEPVVSNINAVARKSYEIPELKQAIDSGELSVSKARKITPVLTKENKTEWIELAKTSTSRAIEKAVATEKPELLIRETTKYKAQDRIEFKVGISEELLKKLEKAKDLESQRTSRPATYEQVLEAALEVYFEKVDPVRKAERAVKRVEKKAQDKNKFSSVSDCSSDAVASVPGQILSEDASRKPIQKITIKVSREAIPAVLKHAVTLRDQRRCTHLYSDGTRCECTRWLDVHHIVPVSMGGKNELANLKTICRTHHQMIHRH